MRIRLILVIIAWLMFPQLVDGWRAKAQSGAISETIYIDMFDPSDDMVIGPVNGAESLSTGEYYLITISGTYSEWYPYRWSSTCKGIPEDWPQISSPETGNGKVGVDPVYAFSVPSGSEACSNPQCTPFPLFQQGGPLQVSTDDGVTWSFLAPINHSYNSSHFYTYLIEGGGFPALFRGIYPPGVCCTKDNYGVLTIQIEGPVDTYSISGQVTDANNNPLSGVTILASSGVVTTTNASGIYTVTGLISGTYTITPSMSGVSFAPTTRTVIVPPNATDQNFITCSSNKWRGEYYNNRDLQGNPVLTRCDSEIDFYWGTNGPVTNVITDNFSVRWRKTISITTTGWYHFRTFTDDGVRLYVDGEKIIDDWTARSFMEESILKKLDSGSHQVTMEYVEWSNDAMAHLNWYRSLICPSSATDCQFNITPMYQTQYLDKPMPEGCSTEPNQTIARWGCLVTSYSMALRALGVNTDPDNLNHLLSNEEGAYRSQCNAELQWPGPAFVTRVISNTYGIRLNYVPVRTIDNAKSALRNGHPVIMRANNIQHFFLATDIAEFNGQEYIGFIDPHHAWACQAISAGVPPPVASQLQCSGSTLQHITTTQERFANSTPVYYLEPTAQLQTPILQLYTRGAEVLITDNQNQRVGFERATSSIVYEVPNSLYYDAEIIPPGGVSDGVIDRTVFMPETPGGSYSLQVWGATGIQAQVTSDFEIDIVGFDRAFEAIGTLITGTVTTGGVASYQIDFDPEQGTITVSGGNKYIYLPIIVK